MPFTQMSYWPDSTVETVKGLSESKPRDSGLSHACCIFANADLQLLEGRLHLANALGQPIPIPSSWGIQRRIFHLGTEQKESEDGEEAFRFGWIKAVLGFFFYFIEKQENLAFGQPINIYFCVVKLHHVFKLCNHLKKWIPKHPCLN